MNLILKLVNEQAQDEDIWAQAKTDNEAYLQEELKILHELVKDTFKTHKLITKEYRYKLWEKFNG